jgi:hypothetical protein
MAKTTPPGMNNLSTSLLESAFGVANKKWTAISDQTPSSAFSLK